MSKQWRVAACGCSTWRSPKEHLDMYHLYDSEPFLDSENRLAPIQIGSLALIGHILKLVGGFNPSEKYQSVGIISPNIWKNQKCSKPPTRH
jgi:hypothetical protein